MNFKDYCKSNANEDNKNDNKTSTISNKTITQNAENNNTKKIEEMLEKYSHYDQNELMQEYIKKANESKSKGSFNEEKINTIKDTLSPMLTEEQMQYLDQLLNMVK